MKRYAVRDGERVPFIALNLGDVVTMHEPDGAPISDGYPFSVRITSWPVYEDGRVIVETEEA